MLAGHGAIMLQDDETAVRILSELGAAADQHVAAFGGVSPISRDGKYLLATMLLSFVVGTVLTVMFAAPWILFPATILACAGPIVFVNEKLHVGTDGLRISSRTAERFIPWDVVLRVEQTATGARLVTKTGTVPLPITARFYTYYDSEKELRAALIARIQAALTAFRSGPAANAEALLARGDKDARAWLESLRQLGGFREAAITTEALARVAESHGAEPTARAAAAALLGRDADEAIRQRLRIAADACASPKLRVALEKAAEAADDLDDAVIAVTTEP